jgi:hypothetical protein
LNNIRIKALEKKREIRLKKNKKYENKVHVTKAEVIEEPVKQPEQVVKQYIKPDSKKKID